MKWLFDKYFILPSIIVSVTIMMVVFYGLVSVYQPNSPHNLVTLHDWVWHYLLVEPIPVLPNTDLLDMRSRRHLLDVKIILHWLWYGLWGGLIISAILLIWLRTNLNKLAGHIFFVNLLILICLFFAIFFDFLSAFIDMHHLLFPVGSWVFAKDSLLIQLFPLAYFQQFFYLWFGICVLLSLCLFALSYRWGSLREKSAYANRNS